MATTKLFTIAGTSNLYGQLKFRFANATIKHRTGIMRRYGHTDINLLDLPNAMTKDEARDFVKANLDPSMLPPVKAVKETKVKTTAVPDYSTDADQASKTDLAAEKLAERRLKDAERKRQKRDLAKAAKTSAAA